MKTNTKSVLISFLFISLACKSFSQCGVTAEIVLQPFSNVYGYMDAGYSSLQPGYVIDSYEWTINGTVFSTSDTMMYDHFVPFGLNQVCVAVTAINAGLGDTCISTYCNIFSSTAQLPFPVLSVTGTGFNKDLTGYNYGGEQSGAFYSPSIDPGDTSTIYSSAIASHTYSAPGTYPAIYSVTDFSFVHEAHRKIHVNDGYQDIQGLQNNSVIYHACDSVSITISTTPSFMQMHAYPATVAPGSLYYMPPVADFAPGVTGPGTPVGGKYRVPGQSLLLADVMDSSGHNISHYYPVFINDDCIAPPDTVYGFVWDDADADGLKDSTESYLINYEVSAHNYSAFTDSTGHYSLLLPHAISAVSINAAPVTVTLPGNPYYNSLYFTGGTGHAGYNFGITQNVANICGRVYLDLDNDSAFTFGTDKSVHYANVKAHNVLLGLEYFGWTNNNGQYCINAPFGNYEITVSQIMLDSAFVYPDTIMIIIATSNINNQNFAVNTPITGANFDMHLHSCFEARPGFSYSLRSNVVNRGIDSLVGTVVLNYDAVLIPGAINPVNGVIDTVASTITWSTGITQPTEVKDFYAEFLIPVSTPLGSYLNSIATVIPDAGYSDYDTTNNTDMVNQMVIGSFDPNDKLVSPVGYGPSGALHHDTRLHYRINFQNTGTASTINVIVQDMIDASLDLNTMIMHNASHPYEIIFNGNQVTWKFMSINLPDSNTNEPASHGFIEFSIMPKQGLPDGTVIENHADIYFDFNEPVITNSVTNTLQTSIVSVTEIAKVKGFSVYPNPATDLLYIESKSSLSRARIAITDLAGRTVLLSEMSLSAGSRNSLSIATLSAGSYVLSVNSITAGRIQIIK